MKLYQFNFELQFISALFEVSKKNERKQLFFQNQNLKKKANNKYSQHKKQNRRNQEQVVYHKKTGDRVEFYLVTHLVLHGVWRS